MQTVRPLVIVAYKPGWPAEFEELAQPIRSALGPLALRVDHIGSTAVPDLAAKDVIDMQVTVEDFVPEIEEAFKSIGYGRIEFNKDHRPPNTTGDDRDWEKQMYRPPSDSRPINVHVRRAMSANGRYALLFRDYLRAQPLAALAYGQTKVALSQHGPIDWDLYYDVKDPVCDIIMAGAEDWASHSGWELQHYR